MPYIQKISSPAVIANPGVASLVVFVDTTALGWLDGSVVSLPENPSVSARIEVKDSEGNAHNRSIVIDGNGNDIEGQASITLKVPYASCVCVFDGIQWGVL